MFDVIPYQYAGMLLYQVLIAWPMWRIYQRAGFNPKLSLLVLVPFLGSFLVLLPLGILKWPNVPRQPEKPRKKRMV